MNDETYINLIAADPFATDVDQLKEEAEIIQESFKGKKSNAKVAIFHEGSEKELIARLARSKADVVEFTGYGSPNRRVILEGKDGRIRRKTTASIAKLFSKTHLKSQCVLFNNCSSGGNLRKLWYYTENVIQVQSKDATDVSLDFSKNFYTPLALEGSFSYAFKSAFENMREAGVQFGRLTKLWQRKDLELEEWPDGTGHHVVYLPAPHFAGAPGPDREKLPPPEPEGRKHVVWFATNRKPLDESNFGPDHDDIIHYGKCVVGIPKFHKIGSVGTPAWKRLFIWPDDHLRIASVLRLEEESFWKQLHAHLKKTPKSDKYILLFIHGYCVTFRQGIIRAAQLGADLNVAGATALYSWPSKGRTRSYLADEETIGLSAELLSDFLGKLASRSGAEHVHIVAHSMGNRAFLWAINKLVNKMRRLTALRFSQFFLAAPDIDVRHFKKLAKAYSKLSKRTTMYVSSKDKALRTSAFLHEYARAGYYPPITIVNDVDTVEVSDIDMDFLGHSYIAETRELLADMHSLISSNIHPSKRFGLRKLLNSSGLEYWKIH